MHVLNFRKYKIYIISGIAILIAILLMYISFYIVMNKKVDIIKYNDNFLNCKSYYLEYELTVISNKNQNTYYINEWYKDNMFKFMFKDFLNNNVTYIVKDNTVKISNESQINTFLINNNSFKKTNLFSLNTYANILNNYKDCCFEIEKKNINNENNIKVEEYIIKLNDEKHKKCTDDFCKDFYFEGLKLNNINITIENYLPTNILVYNDNKLYINIEYKKVEFKDIESSEFD
jgi:hypothetical protein